MADALYALDFDGVLCDSCGESSISALKAAKIHWPELFNGEVTPEIEQSILTDMRTVRPVVETGYENLLLVRLLLELKVTSLRSSAVPEDLGIEAILKGWESLKKTLMAAWGQDKDQLIELFGRVRDDWIQEDLKGWIHANRFYPGVGDALRFASSPIYIVTTKQARFAKALLKELVGLEIPDDRIYGLGSGPKVEVLQKLQALPEFNGFSLHFVEDRLATLKNVIKTPQLDGWNIYLGTWGYNTSEERAEGASVSRIQLLDLPDFCAKLK